MTELNTTPDSKLLQDKSIPTIKVGGLEWPVPFLAPRQNRVIVPGLMKLGENLDVRQMNQEQYDTVVSFVYIAMTRAHPALTKEEFDDMAFPLEDMMQALQTIGLQTGMLKKSVGSEQPETGEAKAGESQTGTT